MKTQLLDSGYHGVAFRMNLDEIGIAFSRPGR